LSLRNLTIFIVLIPDAENYQPAWLSNREKPAGNQSRCYFLGGAVEGIGEGRKRVIDRTI
jgi:hypothetical protein